MVNCYCDHSEISIFFKSQYFVLSISSNLHVFAFRIKLIESHFAFILGTNGIRSKSTIFSNHYFLRFVEVFVDGQKCTIDLWGLQLGQQRSTQNISNIWTIIGESCIRHLFSPVEIFALANNMAFNSFACMLFSRALNIFFVIDYVIFVFGLIENFLDLALAVLVSFY